ncbi:hypothetical protein [Brevibacillus parabrevis]|nr:hypothetical protein [Brevibacillus parabrevis]
MIEYLFNEEILIDSPIPASRVMPRLADIVSASFNLLTSFTLAFY